MQGWGCLGPKREVHPLGWEGAGHGCAWFCHKDDYPAGRMDRAPLMEEAGIGDRAGVTGTDGGVWAFLRNCVVIFVFHLKDLSGLR